jgi:predicted acylesterase/phospholipase RssA
MSKVALVLAGGGITGAVYEIGALRAIDDLLVDRSVNDFDIYVGTSAGALVSALMANGYAPHAIMQAIDDRHPELRGLRPGDVLNWNLEDVMRRVVGLPTTLWGIGATALTRWRDLAISDIVWELSALLPSGLYDSRALDRYVRETLECDGRTNHFDELIKELYIVATELDSGARKVFSSGTSSQVPISLAVAASSAVPVLYRPVQIDDYDYVDGGLHGAASLDLAIEAGAKLVVCINPMVPLDATAAYPNGHYIRRNGLQAIVNQTVRTLLHSTVRYHVKNLRAKHPDVDIILVQPHMADYAMFSYNPMHYRSRVAVAEHGFASVTRGLLEYFDFFEQILSRHRIRISRKRVSQELAEITTHPEDTKRAEEILFHPEASFSV